MNKLTITLSFALYSIFVIAQTEVTIYEIQGQQSHSPYEGQIVKTQGIVTGVFSGSYFIQDGEEKIAIIRVENWGKPPFKQYGDLETALSDVITIPFKLLLSHDPSHWDNEVIHDTDIAITFSGHTHGMQAGIQIRGSQWSPIKYKYKRWAGLYNNSGQFLYVNRGLGWLGFPGRLGMRPEITSIKLKKSTR